MARVAVGVDVGGTKLLAVALDAAGAVVDEVKLATPGSGEGVVDAIVDIARGWQEPGPSLAVGLGIAGLVDREGALRIGPNLPAFTGHPFEADLATRLPGPVTVDNDANVAAWGELQVGAARGASDVALVTLGTGIGSGHVCGGVLQRGAFGFAGEAGHMVVDPHGPVCPCGRRGCWERFASGSGLGRFGRDAAEAGRAPRLVELAGGDPDLVKGEHVATAAADGDEAATEVVWEFAWWVALGIANLVNILDPDVVVIGGGLAEMGDVLLDPVRARYLELALAPDHRPPVRIVAAELGEQAGAIGAALLALGGRRS